MTDTEYVAGLRARWAYHDANGRPLIGPCDIEGCKYQSPPGGGLCAEHARRRAVKAEIVAARRRGLGMTITESEARVLDGNR